MSVGPRLPASVPGVTPSNLRKDRMNDDIDRYATCLISCLATAAAKRSPRHPPASRSSARNWMHCLRTVGCSRTPIMLGQWIRFAAKSGKPRKRPAAGTNAANPRSSPNAHFVVEAVIERPKRNSGYPKDSTAERFQRAVESSLMAAAIRTLHRHPNPNPDPPVNQSAPRLPCFQVSDYE